MQIAERSYSATIKGYRFAFNGMEQDDEVSGQGNSNTTHFRQYDSRLGRWFSRDPALIPWQTPYASMNNSPIIFNDPLGDDIIGTRREKRAFRRRERAAGTWRATKALYGKGNTNGRRGNGGELDLKLQEVKNGRGWLTINNAQIQNAPADGVDRNQNQDHLYFSPLTKTKTRRFRFNNRKTTLWTTASPTPHFTRNYPAIPISTGFTSIGRLGIGTLGNYVDRNIGSVSGYTISMDLVNIHPDDVNPTNPATYSFLLNGNPWNIFPGVTNSRRARVRNRIVRNQMVATTDIINVSGIWRTTGGVVDACHGYKIRTTVTIQKYTNKKYRR